MYRKYIGYSSKLNRGEYFWKRYDESLSSSMSRVSVPLRDIRTRSIHNSPLPVRLSLSRSPVAAENVLIIGQAAPQAEPEHSGCILHLDFPWLMITENRPQFPNGARPTCRERRKFLEQTARDRRASNGRPCCGTANERFTTPPKAIAARKTFASFVPRIISQTLCAT